MFSSEKKEEAEKEKSELKKKLNTAKKELEQEAGQYENLSGETESIKGSIEALQNELNQLTSDRDAVLNKIYLAEKGINKIIVGILSAGGDDLDKRLSFVEDKTAIPGLVNRIVSLSNRSKQAATKRDELLGQLEELQKEAGGYTDSIGSEITRSLKVGSSTKNEKVNIKASLSFQEDESFFSFSNASGSASGTGEATASVTVDEIEWNESGGLQSAVKNFSGSFAALGKLSAELEMTELKVQSTDAALAHYVDYIRCHIESDFGS